MINTTNNTTAIVSAEYAARNTAVNSVSDLNAPASGEGSAVTVSLSPAAEGAKKLLSELGTTLTLDPAVHLQNADVALKDLMARLGIPETTDVQINVKNDGTFTVEGDHPLMSLIEEKLNDGSERDLRNSLIGAHNGSVIQRIGMAVEMAMKGADANPSKADYYYDWVRNVANGAKNLSYSVTLSGGELSASLVDKSGKPYEAGSGLVLPA